MSAKRTAPYSINQKTLEAIEIPEVEDKNDAAHGLQAQRIILKVKKESPPEPSKQPETAKTEGKQDTKINLFANLFKNDNGVGLFTSTGIFNNKYDSKLTPQAPKINFSSPNLFTGNGFANVNASTKPQSIFGNDNSSGSIFGFSSKVGIPPVKAGANEQQQGDSAELEKAQEMKIDRSKSQGNYQYKEELKALAKGIAKKYKKNNGDLIENVQVVLQEQEKTEAYFLLVRLIATKNVIFTGLIVRGKSEIKVLNKKEQNIEITLLNIQKHHPSEKATIKIQFQSIDVGKQFFSKINDAIKPKQPKPEKATDNDKEKEKSQ